MNFSNAGKKKIQEKHIISIAWILAVLVCVKSIFTDFGADNAYQVAMSYRHLMGDKLFLQMWEPHQMSVFLNDALMFIYRIFVPSYAGVAIYLQICGTLLFGLAALFIYRSVKPVAGSFIAHLMCIFFMIFRVKQTPYPEFANMEILFSALLFCVILKYVKAEGRGKILLLVLMALLTFLQVLSYPTCLLSAVAVIVVLCVGSNYHADKTVYSENEKAAGSANKKSTESNNKKVADSDTIKTTEPDNKIVAGIESVKTARNENEIITSLEKSEKKNSGLKNILIYIGALAVTGMLYAGYFIVTIGYEKLLQIFKNIFMSDTHSSMRFGAVWTGFGIAAAGLFFSIALGAAIHFGLGKFIKKIRRVSFPATCAGAFLATEIVLIILQRKTGIDWNCSFYIIPTVMIVLGLISFRKMSTDERMIWLAGVLLSISSFIATMLLTDLGIITIIAYLVLGGMVSFIPLKYLCADHRIMAVLIVTLVLFHRAFVVWGYGNTNSRVLLTYEVQNIIRSGPAAGIVCDHVTKNQAQMDQADFAAHFTADDKVLLVGPELIDPMDFLYTGAEISNYSTIDTPKYNECLEEYFAMNPGKKPTAVAISCWYGQMMVPEDSYIVKWVESNYECVGDGDYYRFYR